MPSFLLRVGGLVLLLALSSVASRRTTAATRPPYTVTDLGTLGGPTSNALAINDRGQVVGYAAVGAVPGVHSRHHHAFLWSSGRMQDLGTLGGTDSIAYSLNSQGDVVGEADGVAVEGAFTHAVLWKSNARIVDLHPLPLEYSAAFSINDLGHIVGAASFGEGSATIAAAWKDGAFTFLPGTRDDGFASDINNHGIAVGGGDITALFVRWDVAGWSASQDPPSPDWISADVGEGEDVAGGPQTINDHGEVAGIGPDDTAYLWRNGVTLHLGALPGQPYSIASGLNESSQVVGTSYLRFGRARRAFIWQNGQMRDLNDLIGHRGWLLHRAMAINNRGQIVGTGLHNGVRRAFLLTPR